MIPAIGETVQDTEAAEGPGQAEPEAGAERGGSTISFVQNQTNHSKHHLAACALR
jgi:hypothetical protein